MYAKIKITGILELKTGLHIGGSNDFAAIGAVDSPVVRDVYTHLPMIPGSSLKGKLRSLLVKQYNKEGMPAEKPDGDVEEIKRLFGAMGKASRLIFSDMVLCNREELESYGIYDPTEVKFENTINRLSGVANPRQIERAIRGSRFELDIVYNAEKEDEITADIQMLAEGMRLLQYDYLGGHGSRGYGKVEFKELYMETLVGEIDVQIFAACEKSLKDI